MSQGFPKQARILQGAEYSLVLRRPQITLIDGVVQIKARDNGSNSVRVGLVVPKRGTAKAHDRNKIKRIIREQLKTSRINQPASDIVVQVFSKIPAPQLREAFIAQFTRLSIGSV